MIAIPSTAVNAGRSQGSIDAFAGRAGRARPRCVRYDGGMTLKTRSLDSGFGLEALDVDLSKPLSDEQFAEIEQAFFRGQVLAVRAQTLTPAQFTAWGRRFGPPEPHVIDQFHHPVDPNILILSNRVRDGRPAGLADAGTYFHTDYSYLPVPARATTLYSIEVPREGGNTLFANQYAAYDDLTPAMKARIDPLVGIHHYGNRNNLDVATRTVASVLTAEQEASMPLVTHRIARPHPVTGRKALYAVSGSSFGIVGMPDDEARDLLDELAAHATQPKYQLSFAYGVGDVVIWDNASLLHSATLVDPAQPRTLWRITVREPLLAEGTVLAERFYAAGMM
jgi:taurine dioxygenase